MHVDQSVPKLYPVARHKPSWMGVMSGGGFLKRGGCFRSSNLGSRK